MIVTSGQRRIPIITPSMETGGAERTLLGLLGSIDYSRFDVDFLPCSHTRDFKPLINNNVRLHPYDSRFERFWCPVSKIIHNGLLMKVGIRLWTILTEMNRAALVGLKHSVWHSQQIINCAIEPLLPQVKGPYDLAIKFIGIPSVLVKCASADVIGQSHTDLST